MKILFLVPDGVGLRNYLYSDILKKLYLAGNEIIIWHNLSENAVDEVQNIHQIKLKQYKLHTYKEAIFEKFLRETICFSRLNYNAKLTKNDTILINWNPRANKFSLKVFYYAVSIFSKLHTSYKKILKLEKTYQNIVGKSKFIDKYKEILLREKPDVIFNTHQRAINSVPVLKAAEKLKIRTISTIYSWDNLPKARLTAKTNEYIVWSDYMQKEMQQYYPEIEVNHVHVTGTPQFNFYKDKSLLWSKKEFCEKFDLDISRPIICFSGDDELTSPNDPLYLKDLASELQKLESNVSPQVLFRRCPVDFSKRYDEILIKFSDIITVCEPIWKSDFINDWTSIYPSFEDVKLLVNISKHCDVVYNVGSTMALDFAQFNKPAIYIKYDQPVDNSWSIDTVYKFQHFKSLNGFNCVNWLCSKADILTLVEKAILAPTVSAPDRLLWSNKILGDNKDCTQNNEDARR